MQVTIIDSEGTLKGIEYRLRLEGDKIVPLEEAELVLTNQIGVSAKVPVVGGDWEFPSPAFEALGFKSTGGTWDYYFSRWFGPEGGVDHTLVAMPFRGAMNEGMGRDLIVGTGARFVNSMKANELYANPDLLATLKEMNYQGFVTFTMRGLEVHGLRLGMPGWGISNALEALGPDWPISRFLTEAKKGCFYESWTMSLLITRYPWPFVSKSSRVILPEVPEEHFWFLDPGPSKRGLWTEGTRLGVFTSWGARVSEAGDRVLKMARDLKVPQIQFRTDLGQTLATSWGSVRETCYSPCGTTSWSGSPPGEPARSLVGS